MTKAGRNIMAEHVTEKLSFERMYRATLAEVWALWTTKDGLESWFCPDGFTISVTAIDPCPGGALDYVMTAVRQQEVDHMTSVGLPLSNAVHLTFQDVVPQTKLRYVAHVEIEGTPTYDMETHVTMTQTPQGVRMVLSVDPMPDPSWNVQFVAGWEEQLDKLGGHLGAA